MANVCPSETLRGAAAENRLRITTLIADLSRSVAFLAAEIELEEQRVGVRDVSDCTYSVLASSLRKRRANIETTLACLERVTSAVPKAA
jgi:hypothetical protein